MRIRTETGAGHHSISLAGRFDAHEIDGYSRIPQQPVGSTGEPAGTTGRPPPEPSAEAEAVARTGARRVRRRCRPDRAISPRPACYLPRDRPARMDLPGGLRSIPRPP